MNRNPIGVIDSGVGGLSIFKEIVKILPNESFIYIGDSKNCPYGNKSSSEIYSLSKRLVEFLLKKKAKIIVIACNTITVSCLEKLRKDFPQIPIIGTVPVIKTASKLTKNGRIGVLSTKKTANSKYQKDLIKKFGRGLKVINLGTDKLVPIVENAPASKLDINKILTKELKPFQDFKIDTLVLGCSHFPFLAKEIRKILGKNVQVLDSSGAIARQTKRVLISENLISEYNNPVNTFYTTGKLEKFKNVAGKLLEFDKKIKWRKTRL